MQDKIIINTYETSYYKIKSLLLNNLQIDNILHVICVYSNPHNFKRRYKLAVEFMKVNPLAVYAIISIGSISENNKL